jgi:hypothetical protein
VVEEGSDAPRLDDAERLLRRIPPWHFVFDLNIGRWRPSSAAFEDDPGGSPMSVFLASLLDDERLPLEGHPGYGLAAFTTGLAHECGLAVLLDSLSDSHPAAHAHALVIGPKTGSVRRRLARGSEWVVPPHQETP